MKTSLLYLPILLLLSLLLNWESPLLYLSGDSAQYLEYSKNLSWFFDSANSAPPVTIVRSIGFPLILTLANIIGDGDLRIGLFVFHFLLAALALVFTAESLKPFLPRLVTCTILLILFYTCNEIFPALMTEWTCIMLLLLIYATWNFYFHTTQRRWFFFSTILISLLVLVRPVFFFMIILPFAQLLIHTPKPRLRLSMLVLALGFSPLILLMTFNLYRFESFSLSPAGSLNLFGVTASLADAPLTPDDTSETRRIFQYISEHRTSIPPSEFPRLSSLTSDKTFEAVGENFWLAVSLKDKFKLDWKTLTALVKKYNQRVIRSHIRLYATFVGFGLLSLTSTLLFLIPSFLAPLYFLHKRNSLRPVCLSTIYILFVHILHTTTVCFMQAIHNRYYHLTFFPFVAVSMLAALCFVWVLWQRLGRAKVTL